jgi:hypothetical protein
VLVTAALVAGCRSTVFGRVFEYEEEIFLSLDGSVSVVVNASIPALVTLHGASLDTDPGARVDRDAVRGFYECPGVEVIRVSRPWQREGRRFVQVRVTADDLHLLSQCRAFSWAKYALTREQGTMHYTQRIGPPSLGGAPAQGESPATARTAEAAAAAKVWTGGELVGIRMHLPSRITYHNAPSREVERGNILTWEQPLRNRLAGEPIDIDVRMDERSILRRTMTVFGLAVGAALLLLAAMVWWVKKKGHRA